MNGILEIINYNAYDIKYLADSDISYNPALGTGTDTNKGYLLCIY